MILTFVYVRMQPERCCRSILCPHLYPYPQLYVQMMRILCPHHDPYTHLSVRLLLQQPVRLLQQHPVTPT